MQKILLTMMALAMVLALVVPAALADDICVPCTKCGPYTITCPSGDQYGASCWGADEYPIEGLDSDGFILTATDEYPECPVIFNICECEDTSLFVPGVEIGVRMKLLVNGEEGYNGAVFSDDWNGNVIISDDGDFLCEPICDSTPITVPSTTPGDGIFAWQCESAEYGTTSSTAPVYRLFNFTNIDNFYWGASGYTAGGTPSAVACPATGTDRVVEVVADYDLTLAEVDEDYKMCRWAFDIPPVRVSPDIDTDNCNIISVMIELVIDTGSICSEAVASCYCVYDIYDTCCETYTSCMIYPYFTSLGEADFWNGIVITNTSSTAGSATLTAYEQDGSIGTYTTPVIPAYGMFVDLLENITWAGSGLGNARCWIQVSTDFNCDGFAMLSNDVHDSMGYIPSCCHKCGS